MRQNDNPHSRTRIFHGTRTWARVRFTIHNASNFLLPLSILFPWWIGLKLRVALSGSKQSWKWLSPPKQPLFVLLATSTIYGNNNYAKLMTQMLGYRNFMWHCPAVELGSCFDGYISSQIPRLSICWLNDILHYTRNPFNIDVWFNANLLWLFTNYQKISPHFLVCQVISEASMMFEICKRQYLICLQIVSLPNISL